MLANRRKSQHNGRFTVHKEKKLLLLLLVRCSSRRHLAELLLALHAGVKYVCLHTLTYICAYTCTHACGGRIWQIASIEFNDNSNKREGQIDKRHRTCVCITFIGM